MKDSLISTAETREPVLRALRTDHSTENGPVALDQPPRPHHVPSGFIFESRVPREDPSLPSGRASTPMSPSDISVSHQDTNVTSSAHHQGDDLPQATASTSCSTPRDLVPSSYPRPTAASTPFPHPLIQPWVHGAQSPYPIPLQFTPSHPTPTNPTALHSFGPLTPAEMANLAVQHRMNAASRSRQVEDVERQPRHCVKCGRVEFECKGAFRRKSCPYACKVCGTKECGGCNVPPPSKRFKPNPE